MDIKPRCKLIGEDGNIFNLMGLANRALEKVGQSANAKEMCKKCTKAHDYDEALRVIMEYVKVE